MKCIVLQARHTRFIARMNQKIENHFMVNQRAGAQNRVLIPDAPNADPLEYETQLMLVCEG